MGRLCLHGANGDPVAEARFAGDLNRHADGVRGGQLGAVPGYPRGGLPAAAAAAAPPAAGRGAGGSLAGHVDGREVPPSKGREARGWAA